MEKSSHHTYAPYDNKSYKLEEFVKKLIMKKNLILMKLKFL